MIGKSRFKLVALAILLSVVLGGCSPAKTGAPSPPQPITIATFSKALGNSPYYIARHFKWFEDGHGVGGAPIVFKEYNDRPTIAAAFDSGELQVLFSADVPSILCRAQGNDIRIVALSANVGQNILVRSDLPYKSVMDLRGKSLAILPGTSSYYGLLKILEAFGLKEADLKIKYMQPAEAKTAFETNQIDSWAVWAPFVEQQEVSGKGRLVLGGDAVINSVMSVSKRFIDEREIATRGVVSAIQKAKQWIVDNPQEARQIMAQELALDIAVVQKAWGKHDWAAALDNRAIQDIQGKATFLADEDKTRSSKKLDVKSELIDLRFTASSPQ